MWSSVTLVLKFSQIEHGDLLQSGFCSKVFLTRWFSFVECKLIHKRDHGNGRDKAGLLVFSMPILAYDM